MEREKGCDVMSKELVRRTNDTDYLKRICAYLWSLFFGEPERVTIRRTYVIEWGEHLTPHHYEKEEGESEQEYVHNKMVLSELYSIENRPEQLEDRLWI